MKRCYRCGEVWTGPPRPGFHALCAKCNAYLRCCLNCRYCDRSAASGCQVPNTEPVREKDRPCFCEEFDFADRAADWAPESDAKKSESTREKFDRLFKKPPAH
jgi:uncharacterized protein (DUF2237 family)